MTHLDLPARISPLYRKKKEITENLDEINLKKPQQNNSQEKIILVPTDLLYIMNGIRKPKGRSDQTLPNTGITSCEHVMKLLIKALSNSRSTDHTY